jgi:hypothetical protein
MNDNELLDQIERANLLTSATSLADVHARGDQLNRRRHQLTAGVAAVAAVAAIAIAVPVVSGGHGDSAAPVAGLSGTPGSVASGSGLGSSSRASASSGRLDIRTASYEVALASSGRITVTLQQWFADPGGLQRALAEAGVPALVRSGAQTCAYQVVPDADLDQVIHWIPLDSSPVDPSDRRTAAAGSSAPTPAPIPTPSTGTATAVADSFTIDPAAIPANQTLQLWIDNPKAVDSPLPTKGSYDFELLPAGPPHC